MKANIVANICFVLTHMHSTRGHSEYNVSYFPEQRSKDGKLLKKAFLWFHPLFEYKPNEIFLLYVDDLKTLADYVRLMESSDE